MRRLWLAPLLLTGCFSPRVPADQDLVESSTSSTSSGSGETTGADDDDPTTGAETSSRGTDDETDGAVASLEVSLTLDGFSEPATVLEHETMTLHATADGAERVTFFEGDQLLAELSAPPFEISVPFASLHNGDRVFSATATAGPDQADDQLEVAVNINGGDLTALLENIFRAALPAGAPRAGGVSVRGGKVFVAGPGEDLVGEVYVVEETMALAWSAQTDYPLVDGPHALEDAMAVAYDTGTLWRVATYNMDDGSLISDWSLGSSIVSEDGPILHATDRLWVTSNATTVARFSSAGSELGERHDFAASVLAIGGHPNGSVVSVSGRSGCVEPMTCLAQLTADGNTSWDTPLGSGAFPDAKASGRFAISTSREDADSFRLAALGADGTIEREREFVTALGGADGRVASIVETPAGGAVFCGYEWLEGQGTQPFAVFVDDDLEVVWEASPDPGDGELVYGCDASAEAAYVYGLSDAEAVLVGNDVVLQGPAWLARITL